MAMVTGIIVLAGIYAAFNSQQKIHIKEQQVVDAEQNVRGAAHFMVREIRFAGMDETGTADAGFLIAGPHLIQFTLDRHDGGGGPADGDVADVDENITYGLFSDAADPTPDSDGIADSGAALIGRVTTGNDELAQDIHAIGFASAFDFDGDGDGILEEYWAYDSDGDGSLDWDNDTGAGLGFTVNFDRIKAVRIWILARTRHPLRDSSGAKNFIVGDKVINRTDNFKYRLLTHTVKCRNMGI